MKLNKDFPKKIYLDKRVLVNGIKRNNVNYENHLELGEWIQDMIDDEDINIPCGCEPLTVETTLPQACVKFKKDGGLYHPFSCSATLLPDGCTKSYKIFNTLEQELFSGNLADADTFILEDVSIETAKGYKIVEYITCIEGSSESTDSCFEKYIFQSGPTTFPRMKPSCRCCELIFIAFPSEYSTSCIDCFFVNFATLFDSNMDEPVEIIIESVLNPDDIDYDFIKNDTNYLIYEFCPKTGIETSLIINYHFINGNGEQLGNSSSIKINITSCV